MTFAHASRLLHAAVAVLRVLGWAWQWSEQWVDYNSSWEPLLEPGEREQDMTKEELKIVDTTRESRCYDARKCRLSALGAALRNRCFDKVDDFDRESFDRALLSLLQTPSLVGPLQQTEVDFYRHWLGLAYWSKSRYLGFGDDKIEVSESSIFCLHATDRSPKFLLNARPLPGLSSEAVDVSEVDNFLLAEVVSDEMLEGLKRSFPPPKRTWDRSRASSNRSRSFIEKVSPPADASLLASRDLQDSHESLNELDHDSPGSASVAHEINPTRKRRIEYVDHADSSSQPKRRSDRHKVVEPDVQNVGEEIEHQRTLPDLHNQTDLHTTSKKRTRNAPRRFCDASDPESIPMPLEGGMESSSESKQSSTIRQAETVQDQATVVADHCISPKISSDGASIPAIEERPGKRRGRPPKRVPVLDIEHSKSEPAPLSPQLVLQSHVRYDREAVRLARRPPYLTSTDDTVDIHSSDKLGEDPSHSQTLFLSESVHPCRRLGRPPRKQQDRSVALATNQLVSRGNAKQRNKRKRFEGRKVDVALSVTGSDDSQLAPLTVESDTIVHPPIEVSSKIRRPGRTSRRDRRTPAVSQALKSVERSSGGNIDPADQVAPEKKRRGRPPKNRINSPQLDASMENDQFSNGPPRRRSGRNREVTSLLAGDAAAVVPNHQGGKLDSKADGVETTDETHDKDRKEAVASTRTSQSANQKMADKVATDVPQLQDPAYSALTPGTVAVDANATVGLPEGGTTSKMESEKSPKPEELDQQTGDLESIVEPSTVLNDSVSCEAPATALGI